jgi:CHAD domain-containing protein
MQVLRESTTALEASILLCLAQPRKKAVHGLRTSTRRVEAQLELLSMVPGLPPHSKQRQKAIRLLKKLRRTAGQVRDLDVQRDLIRDEVTEKKGAARPDRDLRDEARRLRRELKHKRDDEADNLLHLLRKHCADLPLAFEELLDALAPAESIALSESRLTTLVHNWYAQPDGNEPSQADPQDPAHLHAIRKRAKIARYLAESAPQSAAAARHLAARFGALQQAGGEWHDWLLLTDVATGELGQSAQLPKRFAAHTQQSLRSFKRRIASKL